MFHRSDINILETEVRVKILPNKLREAGELLGNESCNHRFKEFKSVDENRNFLSMIGRRD